MSDANQLVRDTRRRAGLSQRELAERLGISQSAVAHLESRRANPTVATLRSALAACGAELELDARPRASAVDETLIAAHLRLTPAQRLAAHEQASAELRRLIGTTRYPDRR